MRECCGNCVYWWRWPKYSGTERKQRGDCLHPVQQYEVQGGAPFKSFGCSQWVKDEANTRDAVREG